jgi:SAM-dependent methyltransferase
MHGSVLQWISTEVARVLPRGGSVLEVGALDVNGSVRPILLEQMAPRAYVGIDVVTGPGVDRVVDVVDYPGEGLFDVVISTEMLEHACNYRSALRAMVRLLREDGHLVLTARGPGYPRHHEPDHWRFLPTDFQVFAKALGLSIHDLKHDTDPASPGVFFWGRKLSLHTVQRAP